MIARTLLVKAAELLEKYPIVAITGPRQSGKTTLAQQLRPDYKYINLELEENRAFAETDPHGFLQSNRDGVILDEAQFVPSLFPYLKHYTDQRGQAGEYILTGSQQFLLLENITQSLAGRVGMLQLLPFSMSELRSTGFLPKSPEEMIFMGGYPRLYDKGIAPTDFYPNYLRTYVERDVRQVLKVGDLRLFRQFLTACAGRVGQRVNFLEMGNVLGIDSKTVKSWIGILETSYIVVLLPPYYRNFDKRIIKSPKLYFYDTGLACSLLNINQANQLESHFAKGALFENLIVAELLKARLNIGQNPAFYFYLDNNQREIDLISEQNGGLRAIEIKSGKTIAGSFTRNLLAFQKIAAAENPQIYLVFGGEEGQNRSDMRILPWHEAAAAVAD
jgi:predicted AAA+ superfamily ATPase